MLGGTGVVGHHVVRQAMGRSHDVVAVSRSGRSDTGAVAAVADATTGAGLADALAGADVVVDVLNAADVRPSQAKTAFPAMAERVSATAAAAGVSRVVCLSIVGIDTIPYAYYEGKVAQEAAYLAGAVPATVLRTTQFHEFAGQLLAQLTKGPVATIPRMRIQPVAAADVAAALIGTVEGPVVERVPDLAGPEVRELADLVRAVLRARGSRVRVVTFKPPGRAGSMMAGGALLPTSGRQTTLTFEAWLAAQPTP